MLSTPVSPQTKAKLEGARFLYGTSMLNSGYPIAVAVDDEQEIHAFCVYHEDNNNISACKIEYLLSSPLNVKESNQKKVEGAGIALIQYAFEQALIRQKLFYGNQVEIVEGEVAITLQSIEESESFYKHIGFEKYIHDVGSENLILQGENLVNFLKKHGGRFDV